MKKRGKSGTSKQSAESKKKLFVEAYLSNGGNATQAAIAAGYKESNAYKSGYRLTKDAQVIAMLGQRQDYLAKTYSLTTEDIIKSIAQDLHFDPADMFNEDGSLKRIIDLDEDTRMAIDSFETIQIGSADAPVFIKKIKRSPKATAREQAMKHLGMFKKDNEQLRAITLDVTDAASKVAQLLKSAKARKDGR